MLRDRVFEEVRVKRNLSYAPSAFLSSQAANVGGIYVSAVDANQSVRIMLDEIRRLQVQQVDQTDITGVVSQYLTQYYLGQETNAAQAANLAECERSWRGEILRRSLTPRVAPPVHASREYIAQHPFVCSAIQPKSTRTFTARREFLWIARRRSPARHPAVVL